ncbi:MAG: TonB-dependent receptor [Gammaproteobacteria bacterium]|nr:TonB-dependent receptor [Gammaproteobacteria bacterium]MBU1488991.1 TonB-dependent receptor [Gammaproteobacteria bacterium]MBU2325596.1 TonB-dependent receptor [Gammaproteobacteria bacterium]
MKLCRIAVAVTLLPSLSSADEALEPYQMPPQVITRATSLQKPAPASMRVISRAEIEQSAASTLIEVLGGQAGLQVRDTLGDGNRASISLRGFGENAVNNTLVLVDGRRLNNPSLNGPDLNSVPLANIERIEILRGAGTVLYGDQAVGGVINIITRTPQHNEAYIETTQGSHDLEAYRGHIFQQLGNGFSAFASGETRNTDNYRDHNNASYSNAFGRLRYDHNGGWAFYEYQSIDDELLYPGALTIAERRADRKASTSNEWNDNKTQVHRFALEQAITEHWNGNLDYSFRDADGVGLISGSPFNDGTRVETFSPRLTAHWDTALGRSEWLLGHDHITSDYQATYASFASLNSLSRQTQRDWYSQLSQPLWHDVSLTLGYRASEAEDRNQRTAQRHTDREGSTSIALQWQASEHLGLFIKREDVLRWANVNENASVGPGVTFLKPQTGESWESGIEWRDGIQRYQASLYRLDLDNELMYDPFADNAQFGPGAGANINLDKTRREGMLLEGERDLTSRLSLGGQYSFTDAEYRAGLNRGNEVPWVSRHSASGHLNYLLMPGLNAYVEAVYTGARYLSSDDGHVLPRTGGYTLFNAALKYQYRQFDAKLRVNNLTGKRYDSFATYVSWQTGSKGLYPAPEEDVQLSVGYRF